LDVPLILNYCDAARGVLLELLDHLDLEQGLDQPLGVLVRTLRVGRVSLRLHSVHLYQLEQLVDVAELHRVDLVGLDLLDNLNEILSLDRRIFFNRLSIEVQVSPSFLFVLHHLGQPFLVYTRRSDTVGTHMVFHLRGERAQLSELLLKTHWRVAAGHFQLLNSFFLAVGNKIWLILFILTNSLILHYGHCSTTSG